MTSWLFLAVSLWGAWFTWNAFRPLRGKRTSVVGFAAGWLTSELAFHHIAWQAVATVVFVSAGALDATPGLIGLVITLGSWAGLLATQWIASRASERCETALRGAFGTDYGNRILPEWRGPRTNEIEWWRVARPFPIRRAGVERIKDVQYARGGGLDLHLDVYRHCDVGDNAPVLFQIHGGGWVMGSKNEQALPLMNQLAEQGWVCVAANYRLSPHATFPDHLVDLKRALVWIREHIAEYGGDPDFIAVTGGSAGGHLCALMGLTQNDAEYQPGFETKDTRVACCVPFYGVYDFANRNATWPHEGLMGVLEKQVMKGSLAEIPEAWDKASPIARIHEGAPPFFLVHGSNDSLVPVAEAQVFSKTLAEKSKAPVLFAEIPGAQHAFELFPSLRTLQVNNSVCRFLALQYSQYLERSSA